MTPEIGAEPDAPPAPVGTWTLLDRQGRPYQSDRPGTLGGYRRRRIYGRLDCPSALRAIARGGYVRQRVFFADETTARAAGYRPCAVCLPAAYAAWRDTTATPDHRPGTPARTSLLEQGLCIERGGFSPAVGWRRGGSG